MRRSAKVFEIIKYTVATSDYTVTSDTVTRNSLKNNVRPYVIHNSGNSPLRLVWMNGDYFHWIVSSIWPGYPTAIHSDYNLYRKTGSIPKPVIHKTFTGKATKKNGALLTTGGKYVVVPAKSTGNFSVSLLLSIDTNAYKGTILQIGDLIYGLDGQTLKPYIQRGKTVYNSTNVLGTSDAWKMQRPETNGKLLAPQKLGFFRLWLTYTNGVLTVYINGLIDQRIETSNLSLYNPKVGGFKGKVTDLRIYDAALSQTVIKTLSAISQ